MRWSGVLLAAVHLVALISAGGILSGSQITCEDGFIIGSDEGCPPPAHRGQANMSYIAPRDAEPDETVTLTFSASSAETLTYTISADHTVTIVSTTSVFTTTTIDEPGETTTVTASTASVMVSTTEPTTTFFPPAPSSSSSASSTSASSTSASSTSSTSSSSPVSSSSASSTSSTSSSSSVSSSSSSSSAVISLSASASTSSSSSSATPTVVLQAATPYDYIGTYQNPGGLIIDNPLSKGDAGSIEACAAECAAGYDYSGNSAQYIYMSYQAGDQCFCGSALDRDATTSNGPMDPCTSNPSEVCGGYDSNGGYDIAVVYSIVVSSSISTTTTSSISSIFSSSSSLSTLVAPSSSSFSISTSIVSPSSSTPTSSVSLSPSLSSSSLLSSSMPSSSSSSASASASCPAPTTTVTETITTTLNAAMSPITGSSSTVSNFPTTESSNPTASSPTSRSSITTSAPSGPTIVQQAGTYIYQNCYADFSGPRPIDGPNDFSITSVEDCATYCYNSATGPYTYFGIEYIYQCFCSNALDVSQGLSTNCNLACTGSTGEICGGGNAMDVYSATNLPTTTFSTSTIARPTTVPTAAPYVYAACYVDNLNGRLLNVAEDDNTGTIELCASHCVNAAGGPYAYFGMEYYSQCFCGNAYNESAPASTGCSFPCSGNGNEICGGSNAMDIYYNTQLVATAPPQPTPT